MNVILTFVGIQQPVVNYWQKIKEEIYFFSPHLVISFS